MAADRFGIAFSLFQIYSIVCDVSWAGLPDSPDFQSQPHKKGLSSVQVTTALIPLAGLTLFIIPTTINHTKVHTGPICAPRSTKPSTDKSSMSAGRGLPTGHRIWYFFLHLKTTVVWVSSTVAKSRFVTPAQWCSDKCDSHFLVLHTIRSLFLGLLLYLWSQKSRFQ